MKKSSIDLMLLLVAVANPKQTTDFVRDLKALDDSVVLTLLAKLEKQKQQSLEFFSAALNAELADLQLAKAQEAAERRAKVEANRGTAEEVIYLLLTRNKFKVPQAIEKLSDELAQLGYTEEFRGAQTRSNFAKWVTSLCSAVPRDQLMMAALNAQRVTDRT